MSDYSDDMFLHIGDDTNIHGEYYPKIYREKYSIKDNKDYWVTKDGKKVYPKYMKDSHILNTIKMIEKSCVNAKYNPKDFKIYNLLVKELVDRNITA